MFFELKFVLCFFFKLTFAVSELSLTPVILTKSGPIQGFYSYTFRNKIKYSSFKGIRYGNPPIGDLRYKAPQKPLPWNETFQATSERDICLQIGSGNKLNGSIDCLFLNVYTPVTNFNNLKLKAVVFWIYGGTYIRGCKDSYLYGPDFLIEEDIVIVAANYRVTALGFAALGRPEIPGNAGIKDQNLALRWTIDNIKFFGGDPKRITLYGESSGAASVDFHVVSECSAGLFQQYIQSSASLYNPMLSTTLSFARKQAYELGRRLNNGVPVRSEDHLVDVLMNAPAEDVATISTKMIYMLPLFSPILEVPSKDACLTECYDFKYESGNYNQIPGIVGFLQDETLELKSTIQTYNETLSSQQKYVKSLAETISPINSIFSYFVDNGNVNSDSSVYETTRITTDIIFKLGIDLRQRKIAKHQDQTKAPLYYYVFDFDGKEYSLHYQNSGITFLNGTTHGDDIPYVFYVSIIEYPSDVNHPVSIMQRKMTRLWSNFIKYGNPTPYGSNDTFLNVTWPVSGKQGYNLYISEKLIPQFKRPIDKLTEVLSPIANVNAPFASDCFRPQS